MLFQSILYLHVLGAIVLIGTGAGIAFFMLAAHLTRDPATVAGVARIVVLADYIFTATAAVAQPVTGVALALMAGWRFGTPWLALSILLYIVIGLCWLPVVRLQIRMRDLAAAAVAAGQPLPAAYHRLFRLWFALGIPAFAAILAVLWLMLQKPPF